MITLSAAVMKFKSITFKLLTFVVSGVREYAVFTMVLQYQVIKM